jgi:hypothetical protein
MLSRVSYQMDSCVDAPKRLAAAATPRYILTPWARRTAQPTEKWPTSSDSSTSCRLGRSSPSGSLEFCAARALPRDIRLLPPRCRCATPHAGWCGGGNRSASEPVLDVVRRWYLSYFSPPRRAETPPAELAVLGERLMNLMIRR